MDVVRCPGCGEENPSRFRLCGYCGTSLTLPVVASVSCPACGSENPAGFRFCGFCGTVLDPQAAGPGGGSGDPMHGGHPGTPGYGLPPWAWWAVRWAPWAPPGGYGAPTSPGWPAPPPGWGAPPPGWGPPPPGWGQPGPPQPGFTQGGYPQAGYPQAGYPPPGWGAPVAQPGSPPPGWGTPPPGWGQPGGWAAPPAGSPPAGWAPPAAQPPPSQPPTPPPSMPADPVAEPPVVALPPPPPPVAAPTTTSDLETAPVDPGLAPATAQPPPQPPPPTSTEGPSPAPPQAATPPPSDAGRPASATPAAFPGFEGVAAPAALPSQEIRKVVTIIFSDLKGSTALTEKIDAEAINEVKERYFASMAAEITQHGGKIEKYIGDAIMAVFGLPRAHEDDALRAVRAAHGMTQAMHRLNVDLLKMYGVEIAARTGVNTGEVVANTDEAAEQRLATGDAVNVAARLEQAAPANEVLIGEVTYDLVRSHVIVEAVEPLELKGKAERVPAYRLIDVQDAPRAERSPASRSQLIGRDTQLELLRRSLRTVVGRGGAQLATVVGEAGVGKTFLVETFQADVRQGTTVLQGRCLPYGDGITFWPLVEIVRAAVGVVDADTPQEALTKLEVSLEGVQAATEIRDRIASVVGLTPARFPVAEVFWAARRFVEALGARRPVVVCIEDAHNAEPTFLDLIEHILDVADTHSAVLIVATGRQQLADKRPAWADRADVTPIPMSALDAPETIRLIEGLLSGPVDDAVSARVVASSEGNPLFVAQLLSMLVDKGLINHDGERWIPTGDMATTAVPPTIQALLAARLDDLSREERAVMEPASVIGLGFAQAAIEELVPGSLRVAVGEHLTALDRKQFVARDTSDAIDEVFYRFRNLMIKDATYGSLLKRARAQLHERFVTWAERVNRERGREQEFEEILGYHLEQAYRYRRELGQVDDEGQEIATRAAAKLGAAGRRAFARGDLPAAASLLRRAIDLLATDDPVRIETEVVVGEVLLEAGDFTQATGDLEAAIAAAEAIGDDRLRARARLGRLGISLYAEELESGAIGRALEEATEAAQLFEAAGDDAGLARAWRLVGSLHATAGQYEAAAEAAERVVAHATRAGDTRLASRAAAGYATIARAGSMTAAEVARRCGPLLDQVSGDRKAEAVILAVIAVAEAMQGRFDRARDLHARAKLILGELGRSVVAASTSIEGSRIEMLAGDAVQAEALLAADSDELARIGERYFRSTVAGLLAHAIEAQGRLEDADAAVELAIELTDEDDIESQILWRTARAKIRARQGDGDEARRLADEALALAADTDDIDVEGDVHADYGTVLVRLGSVDEAATQFSEARDLYARKGNVAFETAMTAALEGAGQAA